MSLLRGIRDERLVAPVLALLLAPFVLTPQLMHRLAQRAWGRMSG